MAGLVSLDISHPGPALILAGAGLGGLALWHYYKRQDTAQSATPDKAGNVSVAPAVSTLQQTLLQGGSPVYTPPVAHDAATKSTIIGLTPPGNMA